MDAEPKITVNGHQLTEAEATATRVAVGYMLTHLSQPWALGRDVHGEKMRTLYRRALSKVQALMVPPR